MELPCDRALEAMGHVGRRGSTDYAMDCCHGEGLGRQRGWANCNGRKGQPIHWSFVSMAG